jgi:hypothetical protein
MGEEAVKIGLADRMAPAKRKPAPDEQDATAGGIDWDPSVFRFQGRQDPARQTRWPNRRTRPSPKQGHRPGRKARLSAGGDGARP